MCGKGNAQTLPAQSRRQPAQAAPGWLAPWHNADGVSQAKRKAQRRSASVSLAKDFWSFV
jgi:hypothetical protein